MKKCDVIQDLIPLYCDGCASPASCAEVEAHLGECRECRAFSASYKRASRISARAERAARETEIDVDLPYRDLAQKIRVRRRINTACTVGAVIAGAWLLAAIFGDKEK